MCGGERRRDVGLFLFHITEDSLTEKKSFHQTSTIKQLISCIIDEKVLPIKPFRKVKFVDRLETVKSNIKYRGKIDLIKVHSDSV